MMTVMMTMMIMMMMIYDGGNDNGDDDDGDDRANVVADGGDYGCDTVFQMTQLRPRTRRCH